MVLQILIAQYKEPECIIKNILNTIEMQQGIDFSDIEVIIANDGSNVFLSDDFLNSYSFKCQYIKLEHNGISATRNALLRYSNADFVMLCDADDLFTDVFALRYIIDNIKKSPDTEMFSYKFIEEYKGNNDNRYFRERPYDIFCIHGKVFNRLWLYENDIWYVDEQYCFGDTYFVGLTTRLAKKKSYCDKAIYLWKYNPNSLSRNNNYFITRFDMKLKGDELLIDELLKRQYKNEAKIVVLFMLYESYYMTTQKYWIEEQDKQLRENCEAILKRLLKKYEQLSDECTNVEHAKVLNIVSNNYIRNVLPLPNKSFDEWKKDMLESEE